ncbi:MAG: CDP-diacylglycerol--glycerol-3-phosphate 3-phosphatidyltransferase [Elusimicrobia bacterium]|nr:CDP-diacylglycerol--glycerol-3-phosphate 3-phosphatidyltransferase [Elusimicrobiota bacterium]MBP9699530.1 CDP-diacylglycerol--glycerol-3-phosphate 3-phosphatidyltransferase [Elusimicrobiota bacterium]
MDPLNVPNQLSVARLLAVPFFMGLAYVDNVYARVGALLIFVGAGVTDLVDGYLARKHNLVTNLGIFLDPLADKMIITAAFILFVEIPSLRIPSWMVVAIVGREFLITGLRGVAASQGTLVPADAGGKFKTSVQNAAIITTLLALIVTSGWERFAGVDAADLLARGGWRADAARVVGAVPLAMVLAATVVSVWTGASYLWRHRQLLKESA